MFVWFIEFPGKGDMLWMTCPPILLEQVKYEFHGL
jgi:hypothetical protein